MNTQECQGKYTQVGAKLIISIFMEQNITSRENDNAHREQLTSCLAESMPTVMRSLNSDIPLQKEKNNSNKVPKNNSCNDTSPEITIDTTRGSQDPQHRNNLNTILHMNVQSLLSKRCDKVHYLKELAIEEKVLILTLTESNLNNSIKNSEVNIENYVIFRGDRENGKKGGGVINYIHESVASQCQLVCSGTNKYVEYLFIHLRKLEIYLITIYRSPITQVNFSMKLSIKLE